LVGSRIEHLLQVMRPGPRRVVHPREGEAGRRLLDESGLRALGLDQVIDDRFGTLRLARGGKERGAKAEEAETDIRRRWSRLEHFQVGLRGGIVPAQVIE